VAGAHERTEGMSGSGDVTPPPVSRWEEIDPRAEGRPARRYYRLTADGVESARTALALAYRPARAPRFRPVPGTT